MGASLFWFTMATKEAPRMFDCDVNIIRGSLSSKSTNLWVNKLPDDLDVIYHLAGIVHHFESSSFHKISSSDSNICKRPPKEILLLNKNP